MKACELLLCFGRGDARGLRGDADGADGPGHARARQVVRRSSRPMTRSAAISRPRRWPGQAQAANNQAVGGAVLTTVLGAGLGAAIGGGHGAAIGAASGAGLGAGLGAGRQRPMRRSASRYSTTTPMRSACIRMATSAGLRAAVAYAPASYGGGRGLSGRSSWSSIGSATASAGADGVAGPATISAIQNFEALAWPARWTARRPPPAGAASADARRQATEVCYTFRPGTRCRKASASATSARRTSSARPGRRWCAPPAARA